MKLLLIFLLSACCPFLHGSRVLKLASHIPETLDPRKFHSLPPTYLLESLYERLVRFEPDGQLHPAIAETIDISEDKKTYAFHLRESFWSDGSRLVAEEFIEAWKESIASQSLYVKNWYCVKNGKEVVNGTLPLDSLGVFSPDEKTIVVQLERPTCYFLELIQHVSFSPVKKDIDLHRPQWASDCDENYLCNGPFRIESGKDNEILFLEKNPFYWDADSVQLEKVQILLSQNTELLFDLFEAGELDWIGMPYFSPIPHLDYVRGKYPLFSPPPSDVCMLLCNVTSFPLSDVHLRKALAYSVNRKELCRYQNKGDSPAPSVLLPQYSSHNYFPEEEDLKKARFHLDQFRKKHNNSVSFSISCDPNRQDLMEILQQQWKKNLDIDIPINLRDPQTFGKEINAGQYQISFGSLVCGRYNDATEQFQHYLSPIAENNLSHWSNRAFIRLVNIAEEQTHRRIRSTLLAWAEEIMMEQLPAIPLYYLKGYYAKNPHLENEFVRHSNSVDFRWAFFSR